MAFRCIDDPQHVTHLALADVDRHLGHPDERFCRNVPVEPPDRAEVLLASPGTHLFEIEQAFQDSNSAAYLVATTEGFVVVLGTEAMLEAVGKAGVTPEQNRAALATCRPLPASLPSQSSGGA